MKIRARLAGFLGGIPVHLEGSVEVADGISLKRFLKEADLSPAFQDHPCFREIFRQKMTPSVLINGDPLPLPEGLRYRPVDGDEITILTPLAGG